LPLLQKPLICHTIFYFRHFLTLIDAIFAFSLTPPFLSPFRQRRADIFASLFSPPLIAILPPFTPCHARRCRRRAHAMPLIFARLPLLTPRPPPPLIFIFAC
jgi:hypothetical protein